MTAEELYNKIGEMIRTEDITPTSPVWVDRGVNNYNLIKKAIFDVDNDLILITEDKK